MQIVSGQVVKDQKLASIGGGAKKLPNGTFARLADFQLLRLDVSPPAPLTNGGDPQFTSVVNGLVDGCVFHDWLDAYYANPSAPGAVNHHVECFQIGGCQGLVIRNSKFLNGETHALFCRAWPKSASLPGQAVQGLVLQGNVFGPTRHGSNCVDLMDDLADPALGPSSVKVLGNAFGQSLSCRITKGHVEIAGNHFPGTSTYQLNLWQTLGYNVHDNVYAALRDKYGKPAQSPFPGDRVDPHVDLTVAPG